MVLCESRLIEHYDIKTKTLIKINANYDRVYPGCNTSLWFLDALLLALKKLGFNNLAVVEGDLKLQPAKKTIEVIGVKKVLERHKIPFINLDEEMRGEDELPLLLHKSQIINVPVIHTHTFAVISCACKNLFGLLPVDREKYHNSLSEKLLKLYERVQPCFTIVDGTVGLDGGSMRMGNPRRLDLIVAGWDALLIDSVVSRIIGFLEDSVPLLKLAKERGLIGNYSLKGDFEDENMLPNFRFTYKESKIAKLDLWLRRNGITSRFFKYNSFFDRLVHRVRRRILSLNYFLKREKLLNGNWMEYSTILTYNT
ncbi:MAG: DUF362 domain-containing protein [Thermoproteota archaeon]|nr:DUF362 domain-containing protein [Candidatus Brockarchaeota archaeon]